MSGGVSVNHSQGQGVKLVPALCGSMECGIQMMMIADLVTMRWQFIRENT